MATEGPKILNRFKSMFIRQTPLMPKHRNEQIRTTRDTIAGISTSIEVPLEEPQDIFKDTFQYVQSSLDLNNVNSLSIDLPTQLQITEQFKILFPKASHVSSNFSQLEGNVGSEFEALERFVDIFNHHTIRYSFHKNKRRQKRLIRILQLLHLHLLCAPFRQDELWDNTEIMRILCRVADFVIVPLMNRSFLNFKSDQVQLQFLRLCQLVINTSIWNESAADLHVQFIKTIIYIATLHNGFTCDQYMECSKQYSLSTVMVPFICETSKFIPSMSTRQAAFELLSSIITNEPRLKHVYLLSCDIQHLHGDLGVLPRMANLRGLDLCLMELDAVCREFYQRILGNVSKQNKMMRQLHLISMHTGKVMYQHWSLLDQARFTTEEQATAYLITMLEWIHTLLESFSFPKILKDTVDAIAATAVVARISLLSRASTGPLAIACSKLVQVWNDVRASDIVMINTGSGK